MPSVYVYSDLDCRAQVKLQLSCLDFAEQLYYKGNSDL